MHGHFVVVNFGRPARRDVLPVLPHPTCDTRIVALIRPASAGDEPPRQHRQIVRNLATRAEFQSKIGISYFFWPRADQAAWETMSSCSVKLINLRSTKSLAEYATHLTHAP